MELVLDKNENEMKTTLGATVGATLLVAGCCIGAGMIGLPLVSAASGFIPASMAMVVCYFFATATGLLLLEASLWFEEKVSLFSIFHFALGKPGKMIASFLFLFLYYSLFVAYIDELAGLIAKGFSLLLQRPVAREVGILFGVFLIAFLTSMTTALSDIINRYLICGLFFTFVLLIFIGSTNVKIENVLHQNWAATLSAMPIMLVCFGYQNIVPSLTYYLKRNVQKVRLAIYIGNFIPFAFYLIWNFVILGLVPFSKIEEFTMKSDHVVKILQGVSTSTHVINLINLFSLLAIFTSIIPNSISFVDFLSDSMKCIQIKQSMKHLFILSVFLIPPALFSFFIPHLFLKALSIAGGLADVLLLGILPVVCVWIGRYFIQIDNIYVVKGGKPLLAIIFILSIFFLVVRN